MKRERKGLAIADFSCQNNQKLSESQTFIVTVHGFRVQRLWVHLKPACHPCPQYGRRASGRPSGGGQVYLPTEIQKMLEGTGRIRIRLL